MIKVSLIVGAALLATFVLRRRSAAARHWLLSVAIVCAAVTPALELLAPSWRLPVAKTSAPAVQPLRLAETITVVGTLPAEPERASRLEWPTAADVMRAAWIGGAALSVFVLMIGVTRLTWIARRSRRIADGAWFDIATRLSDALQLKRRVTLLQSDHPTLLVTWGFSRPTILLPATAAAWTPDRVRIVLRHELAHIERGDWVVQIVAELLRSIYWFNPLLWIACTRLRQESELACDDAVMRDGVEPSEYAGHLVDLARTLSARAWSPAPAMARPSSLHRRVSAMLNAHANRHPLTRSGRVGTAILLAALTFTVAGYSVAGQNEAAFTGVAVDAIGRVMPNATLILTNVHTKTTQETQTDSTGHFAFHGLAAGEYLLEDRVMGFGTHHRVMLDEGEHLEQSVTLQVGKVQETISVDGSAREPATPQSAQDRRRRREAVGPDPCAQSAVGGCIKPPTKIRDVKPVYSQALIDAKLDGQLVFEGRIGTDGFIKDLRVMSFEGRIAVPDRLPVTSPANPELVKAAADAIRQWEFTPTQLGGVAIETAITIKVNFIATP